MYRPSTKPVNPNLNVYEAFISNLKKNKELQNKSRKPPKNLSLDMLNEKQTKAYNIVKKHLETRKPIKPLRLIILGVAGSGKTLLISFIKELIEKHGEKCKIAAFTGNSAQLAGGRTYHSMLGLPIFNRNANFGQPH